MANITLSPEVRNVLERSTMTRTSLKLPAQLDRKLYEAVNKVITLAGGKWKRAAQAHVFNCDPREKLGLTLATGIAVDEKKLFQFFPTPAELARRVVQLADVRGRVVLEPSAGDGALARTCREHGAQQVCCIEIETGRAGLLTRAGFHTVCGDFLAQPPPKTRFDRIVMNPPFTKKQDLQHVAQAVKHWLAPGGRLVAVMLPHDEDDLVAYVGEHCSFTTEEIEAGAFKESGTNITTMLLILDNDHHQPEHAKLAATPMQRANPLLAGRRTGIAPQNLQAHLDSARNAAAKGQAQFYTPLEWARLLALPLANYRHTLVDLNCGTGQLLAGAAAPCTQRLLGCDIEALGHRGTENTEADRSQLGVANHFVHADVTQFYPLLQQVGFEADVFVLNPPWDLHWYRERLAPLAASACPAVALAFAAHDGRTAADTIDSTVATLCMALDRCSACGEGVLIANHATLDRLIFAPGAPHAALAAHVWARLAVQGNICSGKPVKADDSFFTGIIYFARSHTRGAQGCRMFDHESTLLAIRRHCEQLQDQRLSLREGAGPRNYLFTEDVHVLWEAAAEEWRVRQQAARQSDNPWNIWLDVDGRLRTNLSVFDERANAVKQQEAVNLHLLNGRHPMQLVLQKNDRKNLERAAFGDVWRVAPAVVDAVRAALQEYAAVRSPLKPLNKIQRLGYLNDNDDILCLQSFGPFTAGARYPIRTETLGYKRWGGKMNLLGGLDEVEWEGAELAIYIGERLFMDARLREQDVRLSIEDEDEAEARTCPIEYTLQELVEHFEIPEVPDVATRNPEGYQRNLELLAEIERIVNA